MFAHITVPADSLRPLSSTITIWSPLLSRKRGGDAGAEQKYWADPRLTPGRQALKPLLYFAERSNSFPKIVMKVLQSGDKGKRVAIPR